MNPLHDHQLPFVGSDGDQHSPGTAIVANACQGATAPDVHAKEGDPREPDLAWVMSARPGTAEFQRRKALLDRSIDSIGREHRLKRREALATGAESAQLEFWPEPVRKVPVALMRSALFAVTNARKTRKVFNEFTTLSATKDIRLAYKGEELTQADLTIWMQDLHLARGLPLRNHPVVYVPRKFLQSIGLGDGKKNYQSLWDSQRRLRSASLQIETKSFEYEGSLVLEVLREKEQEDDKARTVVRLSPTLVEMFDRSDAWHHWQQRLALRKDPLAQRLMSLWATFAEPLPYSTQLLFELAGLADNSATSRRQKLRRVCDSLQAVGFLTGYRMDVDKDVLQPYRAPVPLTAAGSSHHDKPGRVAPKRSEPRTRA